MTTLETYKLNNSSPATVEEIWQSIEDRAETSFFLSSHWIGAWLRTVKPPTLCIVATQRDVPIGAALIVRAPRTIRNPLRTQYRLHETGIAQTDALFIEYNSVLSDQSNVQAATKAILDRLRCELETPWRFLARNELIVSGATTPFANLVREIWPSTHVTREERSPFVDLARLRQARISHLTALSTNARQQLRRAKRAFENIGALTFERAQTKSCALEYLEGMKPLHIARWRSKARPSAFENPAFEPMLRNLIERGVASGVVDVVRISAGNYRFGYLVNFNYRGCIMNYTSGFDFGRDPRLKPGLVSHLLAIENAEARGAGYYKFLAGGSRYKESLSTDSEALVWLRLRL